MSGEKKEGGGGGGVGGGGLGICETRKIGDKIKLKKWDLICK